MRLIINGEEKNTKTNIILDLINELGIAEKTIAIAVNMDVIKKDIWCKYKLKDGDKIEFIQFVGGG